MGIFDNFFKQQGPPREQVKASETVLNRLKEARGEETGKWLALMRDPQDIVPTGPPPTIEDVDKRETVDAVIYTPPFEAVYTALSPSEKSTDAVVSVPSLQQSTMTDWVDRIFDEFTRHASEFNQTAIGTELIINVQRPEFSFEPTEYGPDGPITRLRVFKGHLDTLHWAMLFQGNNEKISIYVLPSEAILGLTLNDVQKTSYAPFMTIDSLIKNGVQEWHIGGTTITYAMIPLVAKELIGDLIRIASGKMSEAELFQHHTIELKLGETVAHGYTFPAEKTIPPDITMAPLDLLYPHESATPKPAVPDTQSKQIDLKALPTWAACDTLIKTLDEDLARLMYNTPSGEGDAANQIHTLSEKLRQLSTDILALKKDYQENP
jgi:hypothetical protein